MSKHKKLNFYSTDPNYVFPSEELEEFDTLPPNQQKLRIHRESKGRGGKEVSIIVGFIGKESDLDILGKNIKAKCGTGGSVKEGEIIIQGDHREKILNFLKESGYSQTKLAGG